MSLPGRIRDAGTTTGRGESAGFGAWALRRAVIAMALPLALGACSGLPDWLGSRPDLASPAEAGFATAALPATGGGTPADAAVALAADDFQLTGLDWQRAGPSAADLAAPAPSQPAVAPKQRLPQLAALADGDLDEMRGGFLFGNGVLLNFGATIRNFVRNEVADVVVKHNFTFTDSLTGVVVQSTVDGTAPVVTVNGGPPPVDPTPVSLTEGVQLATGDPETTLVVTDLSSKGVETLISNVANNADAAAQTELNFWLGGSIGDLANADYNLAVSSLTGGLNNSLINALP